MTGIENSRQWSLNVVVRLLMFCAYTLLLAILTDALKRRDLHVRRVVDVINDGQAEYI